MFNFGHYIMYFKVHNGEKLLSEIKEKDKATSINNFVAISSFEEASNQFGKQKRSR